ncbi:MAG: DUF58 domain-containing protein, partial [Chloroflexi bacterium]|nr:DUF58 domain-containing protein [Chloroflexota bacterium]
MPLCDAGTAQVPEERPHRGRSGARGGAAACDEPRRLDWRILGRTDRPYVREYHEETNLRAVIVLDRSGSMGYRRRFESK